MKPSLSLLIAFLLLTTPARAADPAQDWIGHYHYDFVTQTAAQAAAIEFDLTISADPKQPCQLTVQGFQTDDTLLCTFDATPTNLTVKFKSYADGSVKNNFDVAMYGVNKPLLTLDKDASGALKTTWVEKNLYPEDNTPPPGKFFVKQAK